jgi:redox-sensing transcriptional repressor
MIRKPALAPEAVSEVTARRLSVYLRGLEALESRGLRTVSSHDFARRLHLNSAQIRKDLAMFGEFGIRGVGYEVSSLKSHLIALLGLDETKNVVICGAGHLGQALAGYGGFNSSGFRITALFDVDPGKIGTRLKNGAAIFDAASLGGFAAQNRIDIGVIAVPAGAAGRTFEALRAAKIRAVLNFAPVRLRAPRGVFIKDVDLKISLETLSFYLKNT